MKVFSIFFFSDKRLMLKMSAVETLYSDQFKLSKTKLTSPPQKITSDKFITYKIKKISS